MYLIFRVLFKFKDTLSYLVKEEAEFHSFNCFVIILNKDCNMGSYVPNKYVKRKKKPKHRIILLWNIKNIKHVFILINLPEPFPIYLEFFLKQADIQHCMLKYNKHDEIFYN